jgi:predicted amidohydrolase
MPGRTPHRVRVAAVQYLIRPVDAMDQFAEQVSGVVRTAADYGCELVVLPEYFTIQLMTREDLDGPVPQQVRRLARRVPEYVQLMSSLAREYGLYIVAGSIPVADEADDQVIYNDSFLFGPSGEHAVQGKVHMTRWEREDWEMSPRRKYHVFDTSLGKIAIAICYDVEFPEVIRAAAREGVYLVVVPSCTDDRQGFLRVRYCAQARCVENTLYCVHACTVGSLPMVPAVSMNYGQASILTPSDFPFARDGIVAQGNVNQEQIVIGELNFDTIREARADGTVLPLTDSQTTAEVLQQLDVVQVV